MAPNLQIYLSLLFFGCPGCRAGHVTPKINFDRYISKFGAISIRFIYIVDLRYYHIYSIWDARKCLEASELHISRQTQNDLVGDWALLLVLTTVVCGISKYVCKDGEIVPRSRDSPATDTAALAGDSGNVSTDVYCEQGDPPHTAAAPGPGTIALSQQEGLKNLC